MKKTFLSGALVMAAASLMAIGAQATSADAALKSAKVGYADEKLTITATKGEAGAGVKYMFYTTSKVSTTNVPVNNKWMKLDKANELDISDITRKTTVYFAESPNPVEAENVLKVEIPAQRKITGVTYTAGKKTVKETFLSKAKYGGINTTGNLSADDILLDVDGKTTTLKDFFGSSAYRTAQKKGQTIRLVYKANASVEFSTAKETVNGNETGLWLATTAESDNEVRALRPSAPCSVKIKQAPAAPVVKISYAKHTMALKKGQSYSKADNYDASSWDVVTVNSNGELQPASQGWTPANPPERSTTEDITVVPGQIYAVGTEATDKAPRSLLTYVAVPETPDFKDLGAVVIRGKSVTKDTAESRTVTLEFSSNKDGATKYEYCIVENAEQYFGSNGSFDYEKSKALKWYVVSVGQGAAKRNVTISNRKGALAEKDILVRVAAGKNTFSSTVAVLENGTDDSKTWKIRYENKQTGLTDGKFDPSTGESGSDISASYNATSAKIEVTATGATFGTLPEGTNVTVDRQPVEGGITVSSDKKSISFALPEGVLKKTLNGTDVTVVIPEGYLVTGTTPLSIQTIKVNVDKEGPKIKAISAEKKKGSYTESTITLILDGPVKVKNAEVPAEGKTLGASDIIIKDSAKEDAVSVSRIITGVKVAKSEDGKTYTVQVTIETEKEDLKITMLYVSLNPESFTDLAGNKANVDNKAVKNPNGNAKAAPAKVTVPTGKKTDSKGALTLTLKSNNALDAATVTNSAVSVTPGSGVKVEAKLREDGMILTLEVTGATAGEEDKEVTITLKNLKDRRGFDVTVDEIKFTIPKKKENGGDNTPAG